MSYNKLHVGSQGALLHTATQDPGRLVHYYLPSQSLFCLWRRVGWPAGDMSLSSIGLNQLDGLLRALGLVDVGKEMGCLVGINVFITETREKSYILQNMVFGQSESS